MGKDKPHCLIYAENSNNIVIEGLGVIDGRGTPEYFPRIRSQGKETTKRPRLLRMVNCDQLTFTGGLLLLAIGRRKV